MQGLAQAAGQHDGVDNPKYQCRNRKKTDSNALLSYGQAIDAYAVNHQGASGTAKQPATVNGGLAEQTIKQVNADRRVNKRSEEHTSELQSRGHLVCRLLLEKTQTPATRYP